MNEPKEDRWKSFETVGNTRKRRRHGRLVIIAILAGLGVVAWLVWLR